MACGSCGGKARPGMAYKVKAPGRDPEYVDTIGEAKILRAAYGVTTVIMQVSKGEADQARAGLES